MELLYDILGIAVIGCAAVIILGVIKMLICDWLDDHWR